MVDDDKLNMQIRKFLKEDGVTSQREIEKAVVAMQGKDNFPKGRPITAVMTLKIADLELEHVVEGSLEVE